MAQVETHLVTIDPPSDHRLTYLVVCSNHDMSVSFLNKVEAFDAAYEHIKNRRLINSLEIGDYQFDDGKKYEQA